MDKYTTPPPRSKGTRLFFLLLLPLLGGCNTNNVTEKLNQFGAQVGEVIDTRITPLVNRGLSRLERLMDQHGGRLSELFGDPVDKKASYTRLADACPQAIEPIREAAEKTGISANYLLALANQESGCRADARADTTTAAGMFQFVERTWLLSMKQHGEKYGHAEQAAAITVDASQRPRVKDRQLRRDILDLRHDAQLSALLAAELALDNHTFLKRKLGRELSATDLYMAHFLGAYGSGKFLTAMERDPRAKGAKLFPGAARANRHVFYVNGRGKARTLGEIHAFFEQRMERA